MENDERHLGEVEVRSVGRGRIGEVDKFEWEISITCCYDRDRGLEKGSHCGNGIVRGVDVAFRECRWFKGGENVGGNGREGLAIVGEDLLTSTGGGEERV